MGDIQISPLAISAGSDKRALQTLKHFQAYYAEYYGANFADLSFVLKGEWGHAEVLSYKVEDRLAWPLDGLRIDINTPDSKVEKEAIVAIVSEIEKRALDNGCTEITIRDQLHENNLSLLGENLFNARYQSKIVFDMMIDFNGFDEAVYFRNIRKSYKSLISWGRRELEIKVIDKNNLSREDFLGFKAFHLKISGRQTRTDESWDLQYKIIEDGLGELLLAYYNGELVAGSLFIDQYDLSLYFTGVYERSLFQFGLSHYLLYYGIVRAAERGLTKGFSLGLFETDITDQKWYNIQFFKKGFAARFTPTLLWTKKTAAKAQD